MKYKELLKGTLKTLILNVLSKSERMYGYEINKAITEMTSNEVKLTFGALYPILHKLEADELVLTSYEMINGRTRKYYSLTGKGKEMSSMKTEEFRDFLKIMEQFLKIEIS